MPAGENSLAHRRHDCSRLIAPPQYSITDRLNPEAIFGRKAPLHVDLGCGDGSFICAMAERLPGKNFLGIERLYRRARGATRKAAGLSNVRLLPIETSYAVRYLLPAESVETFYLLFPDPWPKRRHHRRRIVTADFLKAIQAALETNGVIHIVTDDFKYFQRIKAIAGANRDFAIDDAEVDLPKSKFALMFQQKGAPVYSLTLRKTSPVK